VNLPVSDPHRALASLTRDHVALELSTIDICFLAALYLRAERDQLASLPEEVVLDVFDQVCDLVEPGAENRQQRATNTIRGMRDQRMLVRVDATGIVSAGEYSLTRLAMLIVQSFLEDERLTRESLALLTGAVISSLAQIRAAATHLSNEAGAGWRAQVVAPLRVTVGDLVTGIERRQRGLDTQQEEVRQEISALLQAEWFEVIEQCEKLLETMARTLRELNEVLLRDTSHIQSLLQEIQQLASEAGADEAEESAQQVESQVARMAAWGRSRQQAWSSFYQYVHRFLRDVVRLDPDRAISQRLLEMIRVWPQRPFSFVVAFDCTIRLLRPLNGLGDRPPVGQPHENWESAPSLVEAKESRVAIESLVEAALTDGPSSLAIVTRKIIAQLAENERYPAIGRIAAVTAKLCTPRAPRERSWVPVGSALEIEDWHLELTDQRTR
jgi:chromosome partition protein MukF